MFEAIAKIELTTQSLRDFILKKIDLEDPIMKEQCRLIITYEHRYNDPAFRIGLVFYNRTILEGVLCVGDVDDIIFSVLLENDSNINSNGESCDSRFVVSNFNKNIVKVANLFLQTPPGVNSSKV